MVEGGARVLVVDDDVEIRRFVRMILPAMAQPSLTLIEEAETLAGAIARLREATPPDVIVLDLGLPDVEDDDVLGALHGILALPDPPPVVVLTSQSADLGPAAVRAGAQDYVPKEVMATLLARSVTYAVERARRLRSLDQQRRELLRANAQLQHLGASIAHDVKAPLAATFTVLDTMITQHDRLAPELRMEMLSMAKQRLASLIEHLGRLVDEVVLAPDDRHSLISLDEITSWLRCLLSEEDAARLSLTLVAPEPIVGRVGTLRQILQNLVANALRHNPDRPIDVRITCLRSGDEALIEVTDDGRGFPDDVDHLFDAGWHTGPTGNSGLGLAAVRANVEALGGRIAAGASDQGGASVLITLPQEAAGRAASGPR